MWDAALCVRFRTGILSHREHRLSEMHRTRVGLGPGGGLGTVRAVRPTSPIFQFFTLRQPAALEREELRRSGGMKMVLRYASVLGSTKA